MWENFEPRITGMARRKAGEFGASKRLGCAEGVQRKLAELAGGEIAEREVAEAFAVERENGGADRGKHPAHLVVATLGEREGGFARRDENELGGSARVLLAGERQGAAGEERDEIGREIAVDGGAVDFGDFVFW